MESSRQIDKSIKEYLRKEVSFGCPVDNCGSPYLTYHHFDPPWSVIKKHDPSKMIALCLPHHKEADWGAFTNAQLYYLKKEPYLSMESLNPSGQFNWKRKILILFIGSNWFINPAITFNYHDKSILKIHGFNNGFASIDVTIFNRNGIKLFELVNNEWIITSEISDLECPPSNKEIKLKSNTEGFNLNIRFDNADIEQLSKKYNHILDKKIVDSILLRVSGFDEGLFYKSLDQSNFIEKVKELESIKASLDQSVELTTLTLTYKSDFHNLNITEKSIKIDNQQFIGSGNLFIDTPLEITI